MPYNFAEPIYDPDCNHAVACTTGVTASTPRSFLKASTALSLSSAVLPPVESLGGVTSIFVRLPIASMFSR